MSPCCIASRLLSCVSVPAIITISITSCLLITFQSLTINSSGVWAGLAPEGGTVRPDPPIQVLGPPKTNCHTHVNLVATMQCIDPRKLASKTLSDILIHAPWFKQYTALFPKDNSRTFQPFQIIFPTFPALYFGEKTPDKMQDSFTSHYLKWFTTVNYVFWHFIKKGWSKPKSKHYTLNEKNPPISKDSPKDASPALILSTLRVVDMEMVLLFGMIYRHI